VEMLIIPSASYSEQVKVIVGKEQATFFIQKGVLCSNSEFFKAACNDRWESGRTSTVTIAEEDPQVFSLFMAWLATGEVENAAEFRELAGEPSTNEWLESAEVLFQQLAHAYVLGDILQAPQFLNSVIDKCLSLSKLTGGVGSDATYALGGTQESVKYIFTHTTPQCPLRQLVVDQFIKYIDVDKVQLIDYSIPEIGEFCYQLFVAAMRGRGRGILAPWQKDACYYHKHDGQPEGYSCVRDGIKSLPKPVVRSSRKT
jgi:hypothetical protein